MRGEKKRLAGTEQLFVREKVESLSEAQTEGKEKRLLWRFKCSVAEKEAEVRDEVGLKWDVQLGR